MVAAVALAAIVSAPLAMFNVRVFSTTSAIVQTVTLISRCKIGPRSSRNRSRAFFRSPTAPVPANEPDANEYQHFLDRRANQGARRDRSGDRQSVVTRTRRSACPPLTCSLRSTDLSGRPEIPRRGGSTPGLGASIGDQGHIGANSARNKPERLTRERPG